LLFGAASARADLSACGSAYVKSSPDEKIHLYTICLTHGGLSRTDLAAALHNRAVAYREKGDVEAALADFTKSLQYDSKFGLAFYNRALIYMERGDFAAAEEDLSATVTRDPSRVRGQAFAYRGLLRGFRGACTAAAGDFDMAIKFNRKLAWGYTAKAWILATCADERQRDGREALKTAQKALTIQDHWRVHDALAAAYAELGQFDDSVRELRLAESGLDSRSDAYRASLEARLALYQAGQAYRQPSQPALGAGELLASEY
jgi:tetratricopeptide (TPR) repeat protein